MTYRIGIRSALSLIAALLLSTTSQAQLFRAYLASDGNDANPCTLALPCRLLPAALTAVADSGEIWMLDSANYNSGPVNVPKSVTILAVPGALGSVVATGGNAINIATAGVNVALRNLVIVPLPGGGGAIGVSMTAGAGLTVENCLIANLAAEGIYVAAAASVRVTDSTIRGNGSDGLVLRSGASGVITRTTISGNTFNGVYVLGIGANTTTADIASSTLDGNGNGLIAHSTHASGVVKVSIRDSLVARNASGGVISQSAAGASVTLSASNNTISSNASSGLATNGPGSKVWATGNTVSDNAFGLNQITGTFQSAGNNAVLNNGNNKVGAITVVAME